MESFRAIEVHHEGNSFDKSKDHTSANGALYQRNNLSSQGATNFHDSTGSKEWGQLGLKTYEMQILLSSSNSPKSKNRVTLSNTKFTQSKLSSTIIKGE